MKLNFYTFHVFDLILFVQGVHELTVAYVNDAQFSDSSIIILAPVEGVHEQQIEEVCNFILESYNN